MIYNEKRGFKLWSKHPVKMAKIRSRLLQSEKREENKEVGATEFFIFPKAPKVSPLLSLAATEFHMFQYLGEWESVESFRKYLPENVFFPEPRRQQTPPKIDRMNTDRH